MERGAAARLRDAYLEPWGDVATHGELVEMLELACRVARIARSHTSLRAIGDGPGDRWAAAPLRTLAGVLDDAPVGGR
jgi:hypothetical protein